MRALITGVAGMVGSHLTDALIARGDEVIGIDNLSYGSMHNIAHHLDNPRFQFLQYDVLDGRAMEACSEGIDIIFHLAAVKKVGEHGLLYPTLSVIGKGTLVVFGAAAKNGCKVILASTSDVYGSGIPPFRETDPPVIGPSYVKRWGYASAKLFAEQLAYAYFGDFHVPMVILRYCGSFSHRSTLQVGGHIPIFVDAILKDKEVIIHGDGSQTRPFIHTHDLINCTLLAADKEEAVGQIFNIGGEEDISVLDMALLIHELAKTSKPIKLKYVTIESVFGQYEEIMKRSIDMTKTKTILGYKQQIPVREGLKLIIEKWESIHMGG